MTVPEVILQAPNLRAKFFHTISRPHTNIRAKNIINETKLAFNATVPIFCFRSDVVEMRVITATPLRVESSRCYVNHLQEIWTCFHRHHVNPEEDNRTRDGFVWVSRNTAFTEVFLFDMMLQMVFGGEPISAQADIRSQLLFLQMDCPTRKDAPRAVDTVRKALILYAMAVVKGIPDWVFRCQNCAMQTTEGVYYDKLAFDGQQIGFNIRHNVRHDFYGNKWKAWRKPIERNTKAWQLIHIIESQALQSIVTEALRVRDVHAGCDSVHSLCRFMIKVPMQSKEAIRAAVAAVKLFDPQWVTYELSAEHHQYGTWDYFISVHNPEIRSHPIPLISKDLTPQTFEIARVVLEVFHQVIDAKRAAAVLAVQLCNLRSDLKENIPSDDLNWLEDYMTCAMDMLNKWLVHMSVSGSWAFVTEQENMLEIEDSMPSGIAEHDTILRHPYRTSWSWKHSEATGSADITEAWEENMLCNVRDIRTWRCPPEPRNRMLLMIMSLLNEPVSVWLRNGTFHEFNAVIEVLSNAELFCGQQNNSVRYREAMLQLQGCVVLYERIMSIIGANDPTVSTMHSVLRNLLISATTKYNLYTEKMKETRPRNESKFSPEAFDQMLQWTGAVDNQYNEGEHKTDTFSFMKERYEPLANLQSRDFMDHGVWGPDFHSKRPSPASIMLEKDHNDKEKSCSKNFDVNNAFSPGAFDGCCLCTHVKTVVIMFLKQPEGCRMPLNLVVERCRKVPRYIVYDFACGLQKAAIGLSRGVMEQTSFVINPFHFPGHKTCSLAVHQSSYSELRGCNTESQEQRNIRIRVIERTIRACREVHFMHFMVAAHGYFNLKAMFQDHNDIEPMELGTKAWLRWVRDNLFES